MFCTLDKLSIGLCWLAILLFKTAEPGPSFCEFREKLEATVGLVSTTIVYNSGGVNIIHRIFYC